MVDLYGCLCSILPCFGSSLYMNRKSWKRSNTWPYLDVILISYELNGPNLEFYGKDKILLMMKDGYGHLHHFYRYDPDDQKERFIFRKSMGIIAYQPLLRYDPAIERC